MKAHDLRQPEGAKKGRKRVGRGIAAGQGKSAGRGTKGQGSRSGSGGKRYFEGGQLPLVRRLPLKGGFKNFTRVEYAVVNVASLARFEADSVVDGEALVSAGLVKTLRMPIKVLAQGDIDRPLTIRVDKVSEAARAKIEAAGGTIETAQ